MSHLQVIFTSVFLSVLGSTLITLAVVSPSTSTYLPQQFTASPSNSNDAVVEAQSEASSDPLELEFLALIKRNQEISSQLSQYEFSDPQHAVLLQELDAVNAQISENMIKRKSN